MNNIEKSLKRWLKRKMTISLATIVAFAITGNVASAYEIVAGTENDVIGEQYYKPNYSKPEYKDFSNTTINLYDNSVLRICDTLFSQENGKLEIVGNGELKFETNNLRDFFYRGIEALNLVGGNTNIDVQKIRFDVDIDKSISGQRSTSYTAISTGVENELNLNVNEGIIISVDNNEIEEEKQLRSVYGIYSLGNSNINTNNSNMSMSFNVSNADIYAIDNRGEMTLDIGEGIININIDKKEGQSYSEIIKNSGILTLNTSRLNINFEETALDISDGGSGETYYGITNSNNLTANIKDTLIDIELNRNLSHSFSLIGIRNKEYTQNSNLIYNADNLSINLNSNFKQDNSYGYSSTSEQIGIYNEGIANITLNENINIQSNSIYESDIGNSTKDMQNIGIRNLGDLTLSANTISILAKNNVNSNESILIGIDNNSLLKINTNDLIIQVQNDGKNLQSGKGANTGIKNTDNATLDVKNGVQITIKNEKETNVNNIGIDNSGAFTLNTNFINLTKEGNINSATGIINNTEGELKITGNVAITNFEKGILNKGELTLISDTLSINSEGNIAIKNEGGTTEINGETSIITGDIEVTSGNVDVTSNSMLLTGDILGEGTASVSMKDDSVFKGKVLGAGKNLDMTSSLWTMTGDSTVNNLNLDNTKIDMSGEAKRIDVNNLSGNNGTILMDISKTDSDFFSIKGADTENIHSIEIAKDSILNVINNDFSKGGFLLGEADKKVTFEGQTIDSLENLYEYDIYLEGVDKGELNDWYISGYKEGEETEVVESVEDDLSIYMMNSILARQDIDSLHKRLGDIRAYKEESGVWARYQTGELEFNQSDIYAKNKYSNIEVGYDKSKDNKITGFSVNNRTGNADFRNGSGENRSTGITLYRSYEGTEGKYYDIVGKGFFLTNDNVTTNNKDEVMKADYDTYGGSLGLELGKSYFKKNWYLKPHLQGTYTYIKGADYETTTGVEVEQDDYNSLIGKAGLYAGYDFENSNHFIKLDLLHEFLGEGKVKMIGADRNLSKSIDTKETWFEIGIGGDFKVSDNMNIYYELDKTLSSDSFEHWQGTIGFRYRFNKLEELNPVVVLRDFTLKADSYFEFDKSELKSEGKAVIKVMSNEINNEERIGKLKIEGHTDSIGTESYNQKLSERRAKSVEEEFKKNLTKEIEYEVKGYGETKPIDTNATREGRAKNRRVEIKYIVEGQDER